MAPYKKMGIVQGAYDPIGNKVYLTKGAKNPSVAFHELGHAKMYQGKGALGAARK